MKRILTSGIVAAMLLLFSAAGSPVVLAQDDTPPLPLPPPQQPTGELERLLAQRPVLNQSVSLREAVAIALKESPLIRGAEAEVAAASGQLRAAQAQKKPMVAAHTFLSGGNNDSIAMSPTLVRPPMLMGLAPGGFAAQTITVMYPLFTGGYLSALSRQAAALRDASAAERQMQAQETALMVRMAYREVIGYRAMVAVQEARAAENAERLRRDTVRLEQEQIPAYYLQRDRAEVAAAQQDLTNARRDADLAALQLKTVMGIHPASNITISEADAIESVENQTPALSELLAQAERSRPEIAAAQYRVRGATENASAMRSKYRPQIGLFGMGVVRTGRGTDTSSGSAFGVVASIPLYTGGEREADAQTATAMRRRQEADAEQIALRVAQEVESARLYVTAARQNIETAQAALGAAQEEYAAAKVRYDAGRSILTEVLDAQASRTAADAALVQAKVQFGVAQDRLRRATGTILPAE